MFKKKKRRTGIISFYAKQNPDKSVTVDALEGADYSLFTEAITLKFEKDGWIHVKINLDKINLTEGK